LLSSLLLSIERIKKKNETDVFFKSADFELLYSKKEVYNNRDSFPSLEHYTQNFTLKKLTTVTSNI
jgi:hypothetical protein